MVVDLLFPVGNLYAGEGYGPAVLTLNEYLCVCQHWQPRPS